MAQARMDEESMANMNSRVDPAAQAEPPEEPPEGDDPEMAAEKGAQSRDATPQEEKLFQTVAKQALQFLTTPEAGQFLLANAKKVGPEKALLDAVEEALDGVEQAAMAGGVRVSEQIEVAASQVVVAAMASAMAEGGLVPDPKPLAAAVMAQLSKGDSDGPA